MDRKPTVSHKKEREKSGFKDDSQIIPSSPCSNNSYFHCDFPNKGSRTWRKNTGFKVKESTRYLSKRVAQGRGLNTHIPSVLHH